MDYSKLNKTIIDKVVAAMKLINNPEVSPEIRQLNQEILFREVGASVYAKVYDMNAFDFEIEHTTGLGIDDRYYGLAKVAAASPSTGALGIHEYVKNYLDYAASSAQHDAMKNAKESGKFPKVTRTTNGKTCKWCSSKAGTYTNPSDDIFHRHGGCDCNIRTEGYKSRNGLLNNYKKKKELDLASIAQADDSSRPNGAINTKIEKLLAVGGSANVFDAIKLAKKLPKDDVSAMLSSITWNGKSIVDGYYKTTFDPASKKIVKVLLPGKSDPLKMTPEQLARAAGVIR